MNNDEITSQILHAWDEVRAEEGEPSTDEENDQPEEDEQSAEDGEQEAEQEEVAPGDAEGDEEAAEQEEESEGEGEEHSPEEPTEPERDAEVTAFLEKYDGDIEQALKAGAHQLRVIGKIGREKTELTKTIQQLQAELANAHAFTGTGAYLTEEQRGWVEEGITNGQAGVYVLNAIRAGEYDLARAVCDTWAIEEPYAAMRASQQVDAAEYQATRLNAEPVSLDHPTLMEVLVEHYPEMPRYESAMIKTLSQLGEDHPLTADARSQDPQIAARGILAIYEIARSQAATVTSTRESIKNGRRQAADEARSKAVVSSAQQAPSPGETPRPRKLGPGLTMEQLEAVWDE